MFNILKKIGKIIEQTTPTSKEEPTIPNTKSADMEVLEYLKDRLKHLYINICGDHTGTLFDLIDKGNLEGWCWQTTQTCSLFMNDDDYIERGNLNLKDTNQPDYFHSWLCFSFNNKEYVFDPCLDSLCRKELFDMYYQPQVQGRVSAKDVKDYIIQSIKNRKEPKHSFLWKFLDPEMKERLDKQTTINGSEDINGPIFRGSVGYTLNINDEDEIEKVDAHYYMSGF